MSYVLHVNYRLPQSGTCLQKECMKLLPFIRQVMKWKREISHGMGYAGGIEFYPMESNLHFFLAYVGRSYKYTDRAKALGEDNFSTHRVSVGFIWQMPVF